MAGATYTEVGAVLGITQQGVSARVRSYLAASTPAPATPRMSAVMVSGDGSSSPIGRLTGPADLVDKLEKLIDWAHRHNPLAPLGSATSDGAGRRTGTRLGGGGGCQRLLGDVRSDSGDKIETLSQSLAPLIGHGCELRRGAGSAVVLSRVVGPQRFSVEILAEARPSLAGAGGPVYDRSELGRSLRLW